MRSMTSEPNFTKAGAKFECDPTCGSVLFVPNRPTEVQEIMGSYSIPLVVVVVVSCLPNNSWSQPALSQALVTKSTKSRTVQTKTMPTIHSFCSSKQSLDDTQLVVKGAVINQHIVCCIYPDPTVCFKDLGIRPVPGVEVIKSRNLLRDE